MQFGQDQAALFASMSGDQPSATALQDSSSPATTKWSKVEVRRRMREARGGGQVGAGPGEPSLIRSERSSDRSCLQEV